MQTGVLLAMPTMSAEKSMRLQAGSALLWGLVGLLILAVLGITASRVAMMDSRITGNAIFEGFVYQGAEAALKRAINLNNLTTAAAYTVQNATGQPFGPFVDTVGEGEVQADTSIMMGESIPCPTILPGIAMSTAMNLETGGVACRLFTAEANSTLPGTGAYSNHIEGVLKFVPAQ